MKFMKVVLPLAGLTLIGAMVWQSGRFDASAMGHLDKLRSGGTPQSTAQTEGSGRLIRAEGRVTVYPGGQVQVGTDRDGILIQLLVQEKSQVHAGQLIAELRAQDVRADVEHARARMAELDADIRLYEEELRRATSLFEQEVGTRQAVDRARRDLDLAIARRDTAAADVRRLEAVLAKSLIYAPIAGTVTEQHADQGESLREQSPIVTITDLNKLRVEAEVDEFDGGRVALGSEVLLRAEGYDGQQWRGRVEEIPDTVVPRRLKPEDPGRPTDTRVLLVKVALLESTPLKLGQRVEMEIRKKD